jgi:amidophosphoribosyltransferase
MLDHKDPSDQFHDECGVFSIVNCPEAANLAYLGLHGLQHRGQESAGIVSSDFVQIYAYRRMGLVAEIFTPKVLEKLLGSNAIGHVRYSTAGGSTVHNAQPLVVHCSKGSIAVAHNGNLTNALQLRDELEQQGAIFQSTSDTEVLLHLIARSSSGMVESICDALGRVRGSYSILFLHKDRVVAARDPHGIRPLCLGKLGDSWVTASESVAFDLMGAEFVRDVEPGEVVVFKSDGSMVSLHPFTKHSQKLCLFEYVYFARPDSVIDGVSVYYSRKRMGKILAQESAVAADIVIAVPDSGMAAALGYSEESGIPFEQGLIRSHYVGRTFIEPKQSIRNFGVKLKLNPSKGVLSGKRVIVIDDSLVRGTTSRKIVENIRKAGATEVHLRISSPPIRFSCHYGVDTPTDSELIANSMSELEIAGYLGVDSLAYLSIDGLRRAVGESGGYCTACFDGDYHVSFDDAGRLQQLRFEGL